MNRYENINIVKTEKGKRYRSTVKYPVINKKSTDIYIVGSQHDRLDNLAYKYYEDARLWWIIARANNLGKGTLTVPIGTQIRIPKEYILIVNEYNSLNS
jgi:hypothetical protein